MEYQKEPVRFEIRIFDGVDANEVKSDLEKLAGDLKINKVLKCGRSPAVMFGQASNEIYEKIFTAKLEYQTKTIPNLNRGPYQVQEWVEVKNAQVPDHFKGKILYIGLEQRLYLTD